MEDADSDSGFDSDGDWYHAGRDIVHGLRTDSYAVGRTDKKHTKGESLLCKKKGRPPPEKVGCLSRRRGCVKIDTPSSCACATYWHAEGAGMKCLNSVISLPKYAKKVAK